MIVLLLFLGGEALFFLKNKFFFHFFGGLAGVRDFSFFKQTGLYGLKWQDFLHLQEEPFLVGIIIIFLALDVYLFYQIFQ